MSKFKVGDRVRLIDDPGAEREVVVAEPDARDHIVTRDDNGTLYPYWQNRYELVPPDPTEALIAAAYAYEQKQGDRWPLLAPTSQALIDAVRAHREAQQ